MKHVTPFLFLLLLFSLFTGCSNDTEWEGNAPVNRIILAYFGADNNLSGDAEEKIQALCQGWNPSIGGRLFVFSDRANRNPELIEIVSEKGTTLRRTIHQFEEEVDSADPEVLSDIIARVVKNNPAPSYGLIVFSHASGWLPAGTLNQPRTLGKRTIITDQKKEMDFLDFAAAIPENTFDFILFEACFMAGIETAYELRNKTDYILASSAEMVSPGFVPTYARSLDLLFTEKPDLVGFAQQTFEYYNGQSGSDRSCTLSLIRTDGLEELDDWVALHCLPASDSPINLKEIQKFNHSSFPLFLDFADYYSRLVPPNRLSGFYTYLDQCVLYKASTPRFEISPSFTIHTHSGLTTYIPHGNYPYLNEKYQELDWYKKVATQIVVAP